MPTFKLSDLDESSTYGGDNDMFFRQWRAPSMMPILEKKLDRDFQNAVAEKAEFLLKRAEAKKKHGEKFEKKYGGLVTGMNCITTSEKENGNVLRQPTMVEMQKRRDELDKEYDSPSSTATMRDAKQLTARLKPRKDPLFGPTLGLKNLILPTSETSSSTSTSGTLTQKRLTSESSTAPMTPKDNSFLNNSHETVFYQQTHNSFNLDNYNGTRPSFAFSGFNAATSTPVSKNLSKLQIDSSKITEEDDTVFEESKYVTAMESPVQNVQEPIRQEPSLFGISNGKESNEKSPSVSEKEARKPQKILEQLESQKRKEVDWNEKVQQDHRHVEFESGVIKPVETDNKRTGTLTGESTVQTSAETIASNRRPSFERQTIKREVPTQFTRPYILFKNYIALLSTIKEEKHSYENISEQNWRSILKRTVTEKVTIFTQRHTSSDMRCEILDFFKKLLQKKEVDGFAVVGDAPKLQLKSDEDVNYAIYCLVEKYISLAELDDELASTISDLISRLSGTVRRVEKVFIVMMFNKSVLLRQNCTECQENFVDINLDTDEKAILWNRERSLATLFLHVFVKNAAIALKGRRMVLDDELLWRYTESVVAHAPDIPKAVALVLLITTICKPLMCLRKSRWDALLDKIERETLPCLTQNPFSGDESSLNNLKQMMSFLRV